METVATQTQLGFAHFIAQADGLAHFLLIVLLTM
jgi:biopolymer transport protein ExbB